MIRILFWLLGTLLITSASPASAFVRGALTTAAQTCPANDGSSGAPSGTIQYPSLLSGYAVTIHSLGCNVAGVDYYVGLPSSQSLTDWETIGNGCITVVLPGGGGHAFGQVTVSCNSTTINGVDFSLHGGSILTFSSVTGGVVSNSNFGGANLSTVGSYVIESVGTGSGLTVQNNTIDGAGAGTSNALLGIVGGGTAVVEYNYLKNCPSQFLDFGGASTGGNLTYKYNLLENCGMQSLAHLNYQQLGGGAYTIVTEFNTSKQSLQAGGAGEGYQWYNNGGANVLTLTSATFAYNTMIATGSSSMSYMVHGNNVGDTVTSAVAHDNYADPTGTVNGNATGVFYPSTFGAWTLSHNWDMVTGGAISNTP